MLKDYNGLLNNCAGCPLAKDLMKVGGRIYVKCGAHKPAQVIPLRDRGYGFHDRLIIPFGAVEFGWRRTDFDEDGCDEKVTRRKPNSTDDDLFVASAYAYYSNRHNQ